MKKLSIWLLGILLNLGLGFGIWWELSTRTPYGRLNGRAAALIQIGEIVGGNETPRAEDFSPKMRQDVDEATLLLAAAPPAFTDIKNQYLQGPSGLIPVRVYVPEGKGIFPVVVFFHGGGWVTGTIDHTENMCRSLAKRTPAVVVSVAYRLAPEFPYPASLDDAWAALEQVSHLAPEWNGDPSRLYVAGESAGGNLAAALTLCSREAGGPSIQGQVLAYPFLNLATLDLPSFTQYGHHYGLTTDLLQLTSRAYVPDSLLRNNPEVSPLLASSHADLPEAFIVNAQFDPLQDQGRVYAEALKTDGVQVTYELVKGVNHGFLTNDRFFEPEAEKVISHMCAFISKGAQPL